MHNLTNTHDRVYNQRMKLAQMRKLQFFRDLATSLRIGTAKANRRVQLKMPSVVVDELDKQFPNIDRSHLLTQLVVDFITQKLEFQDREVLQHMQASEQSELDEMWSYLEERDAG